MGSRILRIPLDHITQNGQETSASYVKQGDFFTNDYNNTSNGHYIYNLWFKIPEDLYTYDIGYYYDNYMSKDRHAIALKTKKSSFRKRIKNTYLKTTYKSSGQIEYDNRTTNPPQTEYTDDTYSGGTVYTQDYFKQFRLVEPSAFFQIDSSDLHYYPGDVDDSETGMMFPISRNDRLSLQFVSTDYIVISADPFYAYSNTDTDFWTQEYKRTRYIEWDIDTFELEILLTDIDIYVEPTYPVSVYARNDRNLTVSWEVSNSDNRSEQYIWVTESTITITDSNNESVSYTITGNDLYHVFTPSDIEDLAVGECTVHVESTTNYGLVGEATWTFDLTGETDAPEITNVTQNSYPTITWNSDSQISWEMQISNAQGIVYKSGIVVGSEESFTVPKLLEDGDYSIEMRCVNVYGVMTGWSSYFLHLEPTKPDAPEGIIVSARTDFGVSVSCFDMETTGKLLAVRRKDENSTPVVLGEYNGSFVDYLIGLNDYHQYTIRNYVEGYADGDWIDGVVLASGVVIRNADDYSEFVNVWMSEDSISNFNIDDQRSDVLVQCVGRKYPIAERGEWITSRRSFSGFVTDEDFKKLTKMKLESNHVLLQSNGEFFPCYMEFGDNGEYITNGRILNFAMTRIDGDK